MRPERESRQNAHPDRPDVALPAGPRGLVPAGMAEARTCYRQGRIAEALVRLDRVFQRHGAGSQRDLREAALLRAWCLIEKRENDLCRQWLEKSRRAGHLEELDPTAQVIELNMLLFEEQYVRVREEAAALLASLTTPTSLDHAELRLLLGAALRWEGKTTEAVPHLEFAASAFIVLEEPGRAAVAYNFLGWTVLSLGHMNESAAWFDKSLEINTRLEAHQRRAQNLQNLSIVRYKQGRYAEARTLLLEELELVAERPDMQCRARIALGNVERLQGDFLSARGNLLEAYTQAGKTGLAREEILALEFLGDVLRDEGNPEQAQRYYRRGLTAARNLAPEGDLVMELLRRQGECLDLEGRHEEAHHLLNAALEHCRKVGDEHETAVTLRCLGVNSAHLGCWPRAILQLEQAVADLQRQSARQEAMIAGYELARLLLKQLDTGNAPGAKEPLLEKAWEIALGARQINRRIETPQLALELTEIVNELARRRLIETPTPRHPRGFSTGGLMSSRVVAVSRGMQRTLRQCDGFATSDCAVLIQGEAGSGKQLLARRIHENSQRSSKPLLRISCATSNEDLLARQLFGLARRPQSAEGSTAGSKSAGSEGLLGKANGGTLLLANIDELPMSLQAEILHLLSDGIYRPLGGPAERTTDVRLVATASRDLGTLVKEGLFRPDLHFKLRLMTVQVPALRNRPEDAMPLLDHFLTRLEGSTLTARSLFDFHSLEELATYDWPGGAAELEAIAQRTWLNRNLGRPIALRRVGGPAGTVLEFIEEGTRKNDGSGSAVRHPSGMTWASLNSLIRKAGGNKARAARNLGVSRITLYRWLKQLKPED